jgi:large subunit ribosomal protein L10
MKKEVKDTIIVELGEKLKEYPHFYLGRRYRIECS